MEPRCRLLKTNTHFQGVRISSMHLTNYYYCRPKAPDSETGAVLSIVNEHIGSHY